jgi:hypothetical protein
LLDAEVIAVLDCELPWVARVEFTLNYSTVRIDRDFGNWIEVTWPKAIIAAAKKRLGDDMDDIPIRLRGILHLTLDQESPGSPSVAFGSSPGGAIRPQKSAAVFLFWAGSSSPLSGAFPRSL